MEHVELRVEVPAGAAEVWTAITDWERQSEWMLGTHVHASGEIGLGQKIRAFTGIGPIGFWDDMTVTLWNPPVRCEVLHTGKVVKGVGIFEIQAVSPDSSVFIWAEDLEIPGGVIGLLGFRILRPMFLLGVKLSLRKFARTFGH